VPIRVNDNDMSGHMRVTPVLEFLPKRNLSGGLDIQTNSAISNLPKYDTTTNLRWDMPSYVLGLGVDYGLSKVLSFSAGGNYSEVNGNHFFEWDLGLGLCFEGENSGGRLEGGIQWEDMSYQALFDKYRVDHYILSGIDSVKYLSSFTESGTHSAVNFYANLILNTKFPASPINGFVRVGYGSTSLIDNSMFTNTNSESISKSVGFITLTPGLFFDVGKWNRLVLGCQFMSPTSMSSSSPAWMISPVVQFDFTF
jgi:hypothetical protein